MAPAPSNHFLLYFHAAIAKVVRQAAHSYGSLEEAFAAFPFLAAYNNVLADQGLAGVSWERADEWWNSLLDEWEAKASCHLPLRALRRAAQIDHDVTAALVGIGLVEEDSRFGALFDALLGNSGRFRPTAGMVREWLGGGISPSRIERLKTLGLVQAGEGDMPRQMAPLRIPGAVWEAMRGENGVTVSGGLGPLIIPDDLRRQAAALPAILASGDIRTLIVRGPARNGRRTLLRAIASELGRGVLDLGSVPGGDDQRWAAAGPLSVLLHAVPVVTVELAPGEAVEFDEPACLDGPMGFVMGKEGGLAGRAVEQAITLFVPMPDAEARRRLWQVSGASRAGERHRTTSGNVARLARLARARAAADGRSAIDPADVTHASRSLSSQSLETLARRMETAKCDWSFLAVAPHTAEDLRSLESRCRHREKLAGAGGGAPLNAGVRALFSGPSGTGKSLAAQVLAAQLGMDLYRVDLSAIVNKYIGETEKNLNRVFARAEELDVILLLDEGDALLTQRTSVQNSNDRYANLETNFLLQRLETFDGILLVTTNAGERIDGAFQRRMDIVVSFRPPEAAERWSIWQMHLPPEHEVEVSFLTEVTSRCSMTGGQIRNAALHACVLAFDRGGPITASHVEMAVAREYRKSGAVCPLRRPAPPPTLRH